MDALLLAIFNQVVALEHRVALNLVSSGHDTGGLDEGLELVLQSARIPRFM